MLILDPNKLAECTNNPIVPGDPVATVENTGGGFWQHELGAWYAFHPYMDIEGPNHSPYGPCDTKEDAARAYCKGLGLDLDAPSHDMT